MCSSVALLLGLYTDLPFKLPIAEMLTYTMLSSAEIRAFLLGTESTINVIFSNLQPAFSTDLV